MTRSNRVRILIVDDDRNVRAIVSARLRASGYDAIEAEDGKTAIECVREGGIAVVILDATMPDMDGFEVYGHLVKLVNRPSVILLTALAENDRRIRALLGEAVDYIAKPFETVEFLARIAVAARKYERLQGPLEETRAERLHEENEADSPPITEETIVQHLIPGMIADMNATCRSIEEAERKDDLKTIEYLGHRIKGTSGVYGLQTLSDLGDALEISAQAEDRVGIRTHIERLALHLEEIDEKGALAFRT